MMDGFADDSCGGLMALSICGPPKDLTDWVRLLIDLNGVFLTDRRPALAIS